MKKILESRTNPILIPRHGEKDDMRINVIPTINFNSQEWSTFINLKQQRMLIVFVMFLSKLNIECRM